MKILGPVKRVVDYNVRVRAKADRSGIDMSICLTLAQRLLH